MNYLEQQLNIKLLKISLEEKTYDLLIDLIRNMTKDSLNKLVLYDLDGYGYISNVSRDNLTIDDIDYSYDQLDFIAQFDIINYIMTNGLI